MLLFENQIKKKKFLLVLEHQELKHSTILASMMDDTDAPIDNILLMRMCACSVPVFHRDIDIHNSGSTGNIHYQCRGTATTITKAVLGAPWLSHSQKNIF